MRGFRGFQKWKDSGIFNQRQFYLTGTVVVVAEWMLAVLVELISVVFELLEDFCKTLIL